jgi:F420-dependent oxidoreductase-like protein
MMRIGLDIPNFTWPGGPAQMRETLARIARTADEAGFDRLAVMDHFFQIGTVGPPEMDMLEAYSTLGFLAAHTERVGLLTLVTGAFYRHPGILAKTVTTLDVLSGGRAWLGIGAGWNEQESRGLGVPFPPLRERFERLEDALEICLRMWAGDESPYAGRHAVLERPLNSPQSLTRPHPPIMIGGSGERRTLRLVARHAQACNVFGGPELPRKLDVLRAHCEREGRDYADIEKTVPYKIDVGARGERVDTVIAELKALADLGVQAVIAWVENVHAGTPLEIIGREIIPAAAEF